MRGQGQSQGRDRSCPTHGHGRSGREASCSLSAGKLNGKKAREGHTGQGSRETECHPLTPRGLPLPPDEPPLPAEGLGGPGGDRPEGWGCPSPEIKREPAKDRTDWFRGRECERRGLPLPRPGGSGTCHVPGSSLRSMGSAGRMSPRCLGAQRSAGGPHAGEAPRHRESWPGVVAARPGGSQRAESFSGVPWSPGKASRVRGQGPATQPCGSSGFI